MAALSMLNSLKTFGSLSALRCIKSPLRNAVELKPENIWCLSNRLLSNQRLCTPLGRTFIRTNQSFLFPCDSCESNVKDAGSTRMSCLHRQVRLSSSDSKSFLSKMYPSREPVPKPIAKKPSKDKKSKKRPKWWPSNWFSWKGGLFMIGLGGLWTSFCLLIVWGPPEKDAEGNIIEDNYTWLSYMGYPLRAMHEGTLFSKAIVEPSSTKLLPDPVKEPYYQPPYTLVLEHDSVLISSTYSMERGWCHKKRPGLDSFLQQIGPPMFEVVIYTHKTGINAFPITSSLDPNGYVSYRLFRDATHYDQTDGSHIKDLDCLNRDVNKVIIVETDHRRVKKHPHNAILLQKWRGEDGDQRLPVLAAFLRAIAASEVEDVRTVLEYYSQFDDPLKAFQERQMKLRAEQQATAKAPPTKSLAGGWNLGLSGRRA